MGDSLKVLNRSFLYCFGGEYPEANSHAAVPCALDMGEGKFRVYLSSRDVKSRSYASFVEVDTSGDSPLITRVSESPVLFPGDLGTFDDSGVMPTWIMRNGEEVWMYYIGWNLGQTVTFRNSLGLAISDDGGETFQRKYLGPILDRHMEEPHFVASASIMDLGSHYTMVYLSCTEWNLSADGTPSFRYHLKQTDSDNGINWDRPGKVAIDYKDEAEYAISRPTIIEIDGEYHMWFSCRGESYRIGYAKSADCYNWTRDDNSSGISPSQNKSEWDGMEVAYPNVVRSDSKLLMFYNGNRYGLTGFGVGELTT